MSSINTSTSALSADPLRSRRIAGLFFAYLFPTLITWCYFVLAGRYPMGTQQTVFLIVKIIQFAFPAAWTFLALREPLRTTQANCPRRPAWCRVRGQRRRCRFARCSKSALQQLPIFTTAAELIQHKIGAFGIASAGTYFVLAAFYSLFHSLLEEYYWRWFVFQQTRRVMPLWPAAVLSAIGFTLHHIVVLSVFFRGVPWLVALLQCGDRHRRHILGLAVQSQRVSLRYVAEPPADRRGHLRHWVRTRAALVRQRELIYARDNSSEFSAYIPRVTRSCASTAMLSPKCARNLDIRFIEFLI